MRNTFCRERECSRTGNCTDRSPRCLRNFVGTGGQFLRTRQYLHGNLQLVQPYFFKNTKKLDHYQCRSEDRIQNGILLCNRIGKSRACWHIGNWASRSSSATALQAKHKLKESIHVISIFPVLPVQRTGYTHQYPRIPGWRRSCNLVDTRTHSRPDGFGTTGLRKTGYLHCFVDIFIFKNSLT